jgi:PAS domain S-box-containing protein
MLEKVDSTYRTLLESAAEGIVVVDRAGRIVLANGRAEELFGYRREELIGNAVETLLPESRREVHRGHRGDYMTNPRNRPMGIGLDLVAQRKDGSEFPVEISLSHAGEGDDMLVMASVVDITTRHALEEERIRRLERELHALELLSAGPGTAVTARAFGLAPLREADAETFGSIVRRYGDLMEDALEERVFKGARRVSEELRAMARTLGFLRSGPHDVVDIHMAALKARTESLPVSKAQAFADEGRLMALELMGHLAAYYRAFCPGRGRNPEDETDRGEA